jgi:hypothetical protein
MAPRTSFHRLRGIISTPSTGSMYTTLPINSSEIHMPHRRWDQWPVLVCLKAPPSFGQNRHD